MHAAAQQFVQKALSDYGDITGDVVEFGSRNANGGVRNLFPHARSYLGIDSEPGEGVDLVQDATRWRPTHGYACVISTETFEHTAAWRELLRIGAMALAPDGIMVITCASGSRPRHSATVPDQRPGPGEYYGNVQSKDFRQAVESFGLEVTLLNATDHDLQAVCRQKPPSATEMIFVGAGMWRTGTVSLKRAIEDLTGHPCHHMSELLTHPYQVGQWLRVVQGAPPEWPELLHGYHSTLDWPSMAYWPELHAAFPNALVLLSTRDADEWWQSAQATVLQSAPTADTAKTPWEQLILELFSRKFVGRFPTRTQAMRAYNAHNKLVRATVSPSKLLEWTPLDGWLPLCRALGVSIPNKPFPHLNTTAEYRRNHGMR